MALLDHRISSPSHLSKLLKISLVRDVGDVGGRADFGRHDREVVFDSEERLRVCNDGNEKAELGERQTAPTIHTKHRRNRRRR